jgi:hypothetical protein
LTPFSITRKLPKSEAPAFLKCEAELLFELLFRGIFWEVELVEARVRSWKLALTAKHFVDIEPNSTTQTAKMSIHSK